MTRKKIASFDVEFVQVLDEEGNTDDSLGFDTPEDTIKEMYHLMVLARTMDQKLFKLQRSGKIGTYAQLLGEEASEIGSAMALQEQDWFIPSFRELGVYLVRGVDRSKLVQVWNGDTRPFKDSGRNLPVSIPIASQLPHAAGIAWAMKLKGEKSAAIVYFGDGATSEGDFHEALNFAGALKLPVVFFCQNNQWAISTPRKMQTAAQTIAQKAIAYGIPGIQVDGNDALATYHVTRQALERARAGEGPTLIESITFRMGDHTTSDDASKYRSDDEVKPWAAKDPIERLKKHFQKIGTWTEEYGKWVQDECDKEVEEAVKKGLSAEPPSVDDMFANVFDKLDPELDRQRQALNEEVGK